MGSTQLWLGGNRGRSRLNSNGNERNQTRIDKGTPELGQKPSSNQDDEQNEEESNGTVNPMQQIKEEESQPEPV